MVTDVKPGDYVIYRKHKYSVHPGPHARAICPAPHGDYYSYYVDKFWTVVSVRPNREVVLCTRRGKRHTLPADDPGLRRAHWWERLLFRQRFPTPGAAEQGCAGDETLTSQTHPPSRER
jgi:hypothetical protein